MRWWLPLLAIVALGGCLIDQPIDEEEPYQESTNHAPVILRRAPTSSTLYLQRACKPKFSVSLIEDADLDDDLEIRWFINYDDGNVEPVDRWFVDAAEAQGAFRFIAGRELVVDLERYDDLSVLVVEAAVSDGFSDWELPKNRGIAPGRGLAVSTWTIVVSEESWCNLQ